MMARRWLRTLGLAAALLALPTAGAQALTLNIVGGGQEAGNLNYGCPTASGTCGEAARDYSLTAPAAATGSISINDDGTILSIEILSAGSIFDTTPAGSPVSFANVVYEASLTTFGTSPGSIDFGFGTGSVSGTVNGNPFSVSPSVSITCLYPGQCGITFGEGGFTNVLGHDWMHTFNVTVVVPEPAHALLVALGLAGLALRARGR